MNHPAACAAALANIAILRKERLVERARDMGQYLLQALSSLARHPTVGEVRGTGLWAAVELTTDCVARPLFPAARLDRIVSRAKAQGLIIKYMHSALEFAPALVIARADIDEAVRILDLCLGEDARAHGAA
jgi:putrescine aminotransferase